MTKKGKLLKARPVAKKVLKGARSMVLKKNKLKKAVPEQNKLRVLTPKTLFNNFEIVKTAIRESSIDRTEIKSEFKQLEKLIYTRKDAKKTEVAKTIIKFLNKHAKQPAIFRVIKALNEIRSLTKTKIELLQGTKDDFDRVVLDLISQEHQLSNGQPVKTQNDAVLYLIEQFKSHQTAT